MKIPVIQNILQNNLLTANANRERMNAHGIRCINVLSAPGSGKTTLLTHTIPALKKRGVNAAVLVGDLQTIRDAERLGAVGAPVAQINTGEGCHLDAAQVKHGLDALNLDEISLLFIENVGNMVCPAAYDLGEHARAILLSVPEGDDKVAKYPTLFQPADIILLTKVDLLDVLDYDKNRVVEDLKQINTHAPLVDVSVKTGAGMEVWLDWLMQK
jgi:hydrogenase nickel incorporation protein HypB